MAQISLGRSPQDPLKTRSAQLRNKILAPFIVFWIFVGIWYFFSIVLLAPERRFLVPPPHDVWGGSFVNASNRIELLGGLWVSTQVSIIGLMIAITIGVWIAIVMSQAEWLEQSLYPYAILLQVIPILAIVPVLGMLFGFSFMSRVLVSFLIALFPIIINTLFGLKSADPEMHDLFTLQRASRWTRFTRLQLPAALPATFQGFRIAAGNAVIGAIVGDFFFRRGEAGLGILLDRYRAQLRTEELYGAICLSVMLGLAVFWFFGLLSRVFTGKWYVAKSV